MKSRQVIIFIILVLLQFAFLTAMVLSRVMLLEDGATILLECVPVDPRSLMSGDYVELGYKIRLVDNTADSAILNQIKLKPFMDNDLIYVALIRNKKTGFGEIAGVAHSRNEFESGHAAVLRGRVVSTSPIIIQYGIEHYYVPQYEGKTIEQNMEKVHVEVAVDDAGESAIKTLYIEGKAVEFR
jgi:uncharacterized membrane-anchored protein